MSYRFVHCSKDERNLGRVHCATPRGDLIDFPCGIACIAALPARGHWWGIQIGIQIGKGGFQKAVPASLLNKCPCNIATTGAFDKTLREVGLTFRTLQLISPNGTYGNPASGMRGDNIVTRGGPPLGRRSPGQAVRRSRPAEWTARQQWPAAAALTSPP